jgi:di/tripeptidase
MADLICELYKCKVPAIGDSITTYNVGIVEGGTSVNTIAQKAVMLYEYRSDDKDCLAIMKAFFEKAVQDAIDSKKAEISVKLIGDRPCGALKDQSRLNEMTAYVQKVCEKHSGIPCVQASGSTDANIPMSLGVPAVCVGNHIGKGTHTREEFVEIQSIPKGLKITAEIILNFFN